MDGNRAIWNVDGFIVVADLEMRTILTCSRAEFSGKFVASGNMVIYSSTEDDVVLSARDISGDKDNLKHNKYSGGKASVWNYSSNTEETCLAAGPVVSKGMVYIMLNKQEEGMCSVEALSAETGEKIWFVEWSFPDGCVSTFFNLKL